MQRTEDVALLKRAAERAVNLRRVWEKAAATPDLKLRVGVLDGYSRSILHWDLRESMKEAEIEMILERAQEKYPEAKPRIISDNGPQSSPAISRSSSGFRG